MKLNIFKRLAGAMVLAVTFIFTASSVFGMPKYNLPITVSGYGGTETLENFPVLVRLSEVANPGFSYSECMADGADISFTLEDGTLLDREVDTWNPEGESLIWVRIPSLTNGLKIICTYGDNTVSVQPESQTNGSVWTPSGYAGVWHMSSVNPVDSCGVLHGTGVSVTATDGVLGGALDFSDSVTEVTLPQIDVELLAGGLSLEVWQNVRSSGNRAAFAIRDFISARQNGGGISITTPGVKDHNTGTIGAPLNNWYHLALSFLPNTDSDGAKVYINGVPAKMMKSYAFKKSSGEADAWLGSNQFNDRMDGILDEVRLSKVIRSADWMEASYSTSSSESAFLTYGNISVNGDSSALTVIGNPKNLGNPVPPYGTSFGISEGSNFVCSVSSTYTDENGNLWRLAGFDLYDIDENGERVTPAVATGDAVANAITSYSYTHGTTQRELEWRWEHYCSVSFVSESVASGAPSGSVTVTVNGSMIEPGEYIKDGTMIHVKATPDNGCRFAGWTGTLGDDGLRSTAEFDYVINGKNLDAKACFLSEDGGESVIYLSPNGDDNNSGLIESLAKQSLASALEAVDEGGTIILSAGTYDNAGGLTLDKAVTIRGADGVSRDDIIIAGYVYNSSTVATKAARNFYISNKDAMIAGVTITGGVTTNKIDVGGGSIYIASGTVSNCVVRGGNSCWEGAVGHCVYLGGADALLADSLICDGLSHDIYGSGGGAYMVNGRITRCIFRNNSACDDKDTHFSFGNALKVAGGICDNSLFIGNYDVGVNISGEYYGTVNLSGGVLANSTIVGNRSGRCSGVVVDNAAVRVINCIIADNSVSGAADYNRVWANRVARDYSSCFINCISDVAIDGGIDCRVYSLSEIGFVDFEGGDYRLLAGSPAINTGADYEYAGVKALDGAPRQGAVDVGCYEYHSANEPVVAVLADKASHALPVTVTYTACTDGFASDTALSYEWTITNTDSDETVGNLPNSRSISVPFDEVGRYSVKVSVNGGAAEYTMPSLTKIVPNEIYLVPNTTAYSSVTPAYPYDGWDKAFKSIHDAIDFAQDGCTITVTNSTENYSVSSTIIVDKAITIKGLTGTPEDVRFVPKSNMRLFSVVDRNACISEITAAEGNGRAGCVGMFGGGTLNNCIVENNRKARYNDGQLIYSFSPHTIVTNCIIRNATSGGMNYGMAVRMNAGLITHCVISNNVAVDGDGGIAVWLSGGRLENSLIAGNSNNGSTAYGTVYVDNKSAEVVNCTIVDNIADYASGIHFAANGTVANSAIVNNKSTTPSSDTDHVWNPGKNVTGNIFYSAADCPITIGENNISGTLEDFDFVDPENGNWRPGKNSILFDKGSLEWNRASLDLDGNARILHKNRIDIGCYEHQYISPATIMMLK